MGRILIADADREMLDVMARFFDRRGYEVVTASDGLECLSKVREWMPDVLVLEREIPWGGGVGVAEVIREGSWKVDDSHRGRKMRKFGDEPRLSTRLVIPDVVLTTTGFPEPDSKESFGFPCLQKPFSLSKLENKICLLLDRQAVMTTEAFLRQADEVMMMLSSDASRRPLRPQSVSR